MILGIDHVAVLVSDVETAAEEFGHAGFTVIAQPSEGPPDYAERRFIRFVDGSYLELFQFNHEHPGAHAHSWQRFVSTGNGFVDYSLRTGDIATLVQEADRAGISHTPVIEERKRRVDGSEWALRGSGFGIFGSLPSARPEYPFVLEDITDRSVRAGGPVGHDNGATGIKRVVVLSENSEASQSGMALFTGVAEVRTVSHDEGHLIVYPGAEVELAVLEPFEGTDAARRLSEVGPVVYELVLSASPLSQAGLLDIALTCSSRLVLAPAK